MRFPAGAHRGYRSAASWACVCALMVVGGTTRAATYTWSGGTTGGTWNTTSLNWNTSTTAWPNVASPADNATFAGANAVTIAPGTIYVNTINVDTAGNSFTGGGAASSTLAFSGAGAKVTNSAGSNTGVAFSNLTIDTGAGLTLLQNGASTPFSFGSGVVAAGTGAVRLASSGGAAPFGSALNLTTTENASFGGGFIAAGVSRTRRLASITGTTAGAFGTGVAIATGDGGQLVYASGAQAAVNGVTAGLVASNGGRIAMSGSFGSSSRDRFTIGTGSILSGTATATQLAAVRRVSSFSASPTQSEVIFGSGATIATSTNNTNIDTALSAMNLGTATDVYFGLGGNFTDAAFRIIIGADTPWQGFSTDGNNNDATVINRVLSAGTITVNTGNGTYSELLFQSLGVDYSSNSTQLTLGSSTSAPTIVKNGTGDIVARITPYGRLNLDNASVGSFFASYAVDPNAAIYSTRSNAFNGKNISLTAATVGVSGATNQTVTDTVGTLTIAEQSGIALPTVTGGTFTLTVNAAISRSGLAALTVGGASLSGQQKVFVPAGLQRGKMVVPYMVGNGSGQPEFLFLDATNGLIRWNTQSVAYDSTWGQGNVVLASTGNGNLAISTAVSADSFQFAQSLTGSGTISLGVLANGSRAAQAGIISAADTLTVAPAIDLGTAELVLWNERGVTRVTTFNGSVSTSGGLSKNGTGVNSLNSSANAITGSIAVNRGTLRIAGGNGLGDAAALFVAAGGTFDLSGASDQVAALTGSGSVAVASSRTLTVSGAASGTFAGVISGAGGLVKGGAGGLTLSGGNTFAGGVQVNGGTLTAGNAGAFGAGSISLAAGAALDLGSLAVANAITNNGGGLLNAASYAGTQTLAGTSLLGGTIGGGLNVASGGVLKGNGTNFTGAVVIQSGGIHAPGASPGLQTFASGLTYEAGSTLQWELIGNTTSGAGTVFDQVLVTGGDLLIAASGQLPELNLVFDGAGSAVDWSNSFWDVSRTWTVIDFSGAGSSSGTFTLGGSATTWLDSLGASLATARAGNANFSVGSTGGDIVLSYAIVPEPGTATLACLSLGVALAAAWWRKRSP